VLSSLKQRFCNYVSRRTVVSRRECKGVARILTTHTVIHERNIKAVMAVKEICELQNVFDLIGKLAIVSSSHHIKSCSQCASVLTASPSAIHPTTVANRRNASNATNHVPLKTVRSLLAHRRNVSIAVVNIQPNSPVALGISSSCASPNDQFPNANTNPTDRIPHRRHSGINGPRFHLSKPCTLLPHGQARTWAHVTAQPSTSFTQPSFSTTLDSVKSSHG
jgi:hypothetical protein